MAFAQTVSDSHTLDYAKAPPWRRRKSVRRAIAAGVLALILLAALKFARPAWDHARLLHYQSRCLKHAKPPDNIVFDSDSQSAYISNEWDRFYALFSPPGGFQDGTVFVQELRRPDGTARLVAMTLGRPLHDLAVDFDVHVIKPGTLWSRPSLCHYQTWRTIFVRPFTDDHRTTIFAGQCDPINHSHFTIDYNYDGKAGTIDGWLQSDDTILLEPRAPVSRAP
jgi:hypothetical protein